MQEAERHTTARDRAIQVATQNLGRCAGEVLAWRKTGLLPDDAQLRQVSAAFERVGVEDDALQRAEDIVIVLALRQVAAGASSGAPKCGRNIEAVEAHTRRSIEDAHQRE